MQQLMGKSNLLHHLQLSVSNSLYEFFKAFPCLFINLGKVRSHILLHKKVESKYKDLTKV